MNDESNININFDGGLGENQILGITDNKAMFPGSEGPTPLLASNESPDNGIGAIEDFLVADGEGAIADLTGSDGEETVPATRSKSSKKELDNLTGEVIEEESPPAASLIQRRNGSSGFIKVEEVFNSGYFVADETGELKIDYLHDGSGVEGELAIFSLENFEKLNLKRERDFIEEAASRAFSNSELGYVLINDKNEGAYFGGWANKGEHQGVKSFNLTPGDKYAFMLVPNGSIEQALEKPYLGGNKKPLFSVFSEEYEEYFPGKQFADVMGNGEILGIEASSVNNPRSDRDYDDLVINIEGLTGTVSPFDEVIKPGKDWREKKLGEQLDEYLAFPKMSFDSGYFVADETGELKIDYLYDGTRPEGELAIFSLEGLDELNLQSERDFIKEAASRVLSNSERGYVLIDDKNEGALFDGWANSGERGGVKSFNLTPGDEYALMLVPNGTVKEVLENPNLRGNKKPLFSLKSEENEEYFPGKQFADVMGNGRILGVEASSVKNPRSDGDYEDFILSIEGLTGTVSPFDEVIKPGKDWRNKSFGKKVQEYIDLSEISFNLGEFVVGESGEVAVDFLFDGGGYESELAIFSLEGLEAKSYADFVKQAADRARSNSELGHIVINDAAEGAKFSGEFGEQNQNYGDYLGVKTFEMNPGDKFAFMFVPKGSVEAVFNNPKIRSPKHPFFSLATENPKDEFRPGQMGDVTGEGVIFAFEDKKVSNRKADRDYNDFIFSVNGVEDASEVAIDLDELINPEEDWRELELGQELINSVKGNSPQDLFLLTDLLYNPQETLDILGKVSDTDGGSDIARIDFWLQKDGGEWKDIADVTEFVVDGDEARFDYELAGLEPGKYRLKAIAYDIDGNENELTEGFTVLSLEPGEELSDRVKWAIERSMNLDSYDPEALAATREWVVSLKAGESAAELASSFGWQNLGSTGHIPNTYIWEFPENATPEDVAKRLSLLSEVEFAYPLVPVELQWMSPPGDEPLVKDGSQWHLRSGVNVADANVTNVWEDGITGEGVVIGVVDDGFEIDDPEKGLAGHKDLLPNYRPDLSYDFDEEDPYPSGVINGVVKSPEPAKPILDGGKTVSPLYVPLSGFVKELQIEFELDHEDVDNLEVTLVSPDGTKKVLTNLVEGSNAIDVTKKFEKHGPRGEWKLEVKDLKRNDKLGRLNGWSLEFETLNIHGTAAAGVAVAAGDNNVGGSGVAPEAEWAGLRINAGAKPVTGNLLGDVLSWKNQEIDIYSNSYGPVFFDVLPGAELNFEKMTQEGRDGKGNIYVFAGGNGAEAGGNVNYNSLANARQTIAVAAIDSEGKHPFYSESGASVFVSAYSDNGKEGDEFLGITTTGPNNSYIDHFRGTSASTPFVAAGIGLMLEANPNLTVRDVQHILVETANKNDSADGDWVENGAGYWVNHKYGFGAINVEKAVEMAKNWTPVNKEVKVSEVEWEGTGPIPDYDKKKPEDKQEFLTSTIAIDEDRDISVEWVEVMFNGEHRDLGDLEIVLISPDGTESVLMSPHYHDKYKGDRFNSLDRWTFTSARHWGESSVGEWQLRVADKEEGTRSLEHIPGKRNFWTSWQLNLFGTESNTAPEATNLDQELTYTEETPIALQDIVVTDPDAGDTITVTLELNNPAGGSIASGEDKSDAEGALSFEGPVEDVNDWLAGLEFTPAEDFSENLEVTVAVTDNNISWPLTGTIKLIGETDNDAPTVAQQLADQTATEDKPFEFAIPEETFADVDDEKLNYSATVVSGGWLTFDVATGTFSGTPTNEDVGTVEVTVTAADAAGAEVSDEFAVTVENVNDAPTVVKEIADRTVTVGEFVRFAFPEDTFADVDAGDRLFYDATLEDGSLLPGWLFFNNSNRTFLAMPGSEDVGSLNVKVEATDRQDASASDVFVLAVEAEPVSVDLKGVGFTMTPNALQAGDSVNAGFMVQNLEAEDAGAFDVGLYLSEDGTIDKSDRLLHTHRVDGLAGGANSSVLMANLTLPPAGDEFWKGDGTYFVGMVVDVEGAIAESNEDNNANTGLRIDFGSIEVNKTEAPEAPPPLNSPPTLTNISILTGATEKEAFTITYEDLLDASDAADADGDTISFRVEESLSGELTKDGKTVAIGETVLAEDEEIVWTPDVVGDAVKALSVKAFDGEEYSDVAVEVVVAVETDNAEPTLTSISTLKRAIESQPFVITYENLLNASNATDAEGDPISFQIEALLSGELTKNGKTIVPGETVLSEGDEIVWTPDEVGDALKAFSVKAFDGKGYSNAAVEVAIDAASIAPFEWVRQQGTVFRDWSDGVAVDSSGVYTTGSTSYPENTDTFVSKYDFQGNHIWTQELSSSGFMGQPSGIVTNGAGNIYITGITRNDIFVANYNSNGDLVWSRKLGTSRWESAGDIALDSSGNVYVTGYTSGSLAGSNAGSRDIFVAKYTSNGNLEWTRQLGSSGTDYSEGIATDSSGNILITGYTNGSLEGTNAGDDDSFIAKYDNNGNLIWVQQFGTSERDTAFNIATDTLGNIYVSGLTDGSFSGSDGEAFIAKFNSSGNVDWIEQSGQSRASEWSAGIVTDKSDRIYTITGRTVPGKGRFAYVEQYNSNGDLLQSEFLENGRSPSGIALDSAGNVYITGSTPRPLEGIHAGDYDVWLAKLSSSSFNTPPTLTNIATLTGATETQPYTITYDNLLAASNATDADGDALTFQIEESLSGTLTKNGETVAPGATVLAKDEEIIWTPDVVGDAVKALSVKAFDGKESSETAVEVAVAVEALAVEPFTETDINLIAVGAASAKWGDYDSDGDLDIIVTGDTGGIGGVGASKIYNNDNGNFTDIGANIQAVGDSAVEWGDYDNDGDLDLILTGSPASESYSIIYRNDGGNKFVDIKANLVRTDDAAVAWGDYDNDGDLDLILAGYTNTGPVSKIYRNDGDDKFTDIAADLVAVEQANADWGDYDKDGDLDLILSGVRGGGGFSSNTFTAIYRNDGSGSFTDIKANLPQVQQGTVQWGDYDSDGYLDILITGTTGGFFGSSIAQIFRNNGSGSFSDTRANLPAINGGAAWGDYDNDGDLDILITGQSSITDLNGQAKLLRNDSGSFVEVEDTNFQNVILSNVDWGDYDGDGDLDLILNGASGFAGTTYTKVYRNNAVTSNTAPTAPAGLSVLVDNRDATLSWNNATDAETPTPGLSYNLRVGTTPGGSEVVSPMSLGGGDRLIPATGNTSQNTSWTIKDLEPGTYYWSVQAIDAAFAGSQFATEGSFTVAEPPPLVLPPAKPTNQEVTITIHRVRAIDELDFFSFGSQEADLLTKLGIDGSRWESNTIGNKDDISPNWQYSQKVTDTAVPINIAIYEEDGGFFANEELVDINPLSRNKTLNLTYDLETGTISGPGVSGKAGEVINLRGGGDDLRAEIWFSVDKK